MRLGPGDSAIRESARRSRRIQEFIQGQAVHGVKSGKSVAAELAAEVGGSTGSIEATDPEVAVLDHIRLRLEPDRALRRDRQGLFQHLAVAGAVGESPLAVGSVLDGHLDGVPVALLVVLELLVGADTRVVADLELVLELVVTEVETAVGVAAGAKLQAEDEVSGEQATVSITSVLGWPGLVAPVITIVPFSTLNRPSDDSVLPSSTSLPNRQPVRSLPLNRVSKPGSSPAKAGNGGGARTRRVRARQVRDAWCLTPGQIGSGFPFPRRENGLFVEVSTDGLRSRIVRQHLACRNMMRFTAGRHEF